MLSFVYLGKYGGGREVNLSLYEIAKRKGINCELIFVKGVFNEELIRKCYKEALFFDLPREYLELINHLKGKKVFFTMFSLKNAPLYLLGNFEKYTYVHSGIAPGELLQKNVVARITYAIQDLYCRLSKGIFVTSDLAKWFAMEKYPKNNADVLILPPFSSIKDDFFPLKKVDSLPKRYYLFFGAIHDRYKGLGMLLKSIKGTDINLVVAGKLKNSIRQEKVHHINKWIDDPELNYLVKNSHAVITPYIGNSTSAVLALAFRLGIPGISSRLPGLDLFIDEGKTGQFFTSGNEGELKEVLLSFWKKKSIENLGKNIDFHCKVMESRISEKFKIFKH